MDPGKPPARRSRQRSCATLLDSGKKVALIDVREPAEWDINHIEGAQLIPQSLINSGEGLAQLPRRRCGSWMRPPTAREGLRVLEDYARFALDDAHLMRRSKSAGTRCATR